jgi:catecholate siderophore receptor
MISGAAGGDLDEMTTVKSGVWARKRGVLGASGLALIAGASMTGLAHAEGVASDAAAPEVSQVEVLGARKPLDHDTGLSVMPASVQDTPQAITVIGQAQLKAQGVTSLEQALRNVPGITIAIGEGGQLNGDQFKIRGFDSKDDVYVDGLRDFGAYSRDSFAYEEVQVLKGPSGAMFGRGTTGGAINTISKTPKLRDFASVDGYFGAGSYKRALADVNHQLGETSALRLNLMWNDNKVVDRDLIYTKKWGAALTAGFGLGTDTEFQINYVHQHWKGRPDYGIIIQNPPGSAIGLPVSEFDVGVERSTFTGYANDLDRGNADILTARFKHVVSDKLTITSDTRYGIYSRYFQYTTLDNCTAACNAALFDGDPVTEPAGGVGGSSPYDSDIWGLQNITTARIDYDVGGLKNQAIVGIDVSRQSNDKLYLAYTLPAGFATRPAIPKFFVNPNYDFPAGYTLFRAVPGQNLTCPATGNCTTNVLPGPIPITTNVAGTGVYKSRGVSTDAGLLFTDRLWLTEAFSVIGSMRLDRYTASLDNTLYNGTAAPTVKAKSTLKSPRLSGVFEPTRDQTFYVSWGRSQTPQGTSITNTGTAVITSKDLAPETSRIWEAGAKVAIPGTRLSATASVFDIEKGNALQADPSTGFLQAQSGEKQRIKGVELGLTGKVNAAWTVSAGYTYLHSRTAESYTNCVAAPTPATGTPSGVVCPAGAPAATPVLNTFIVGRPVIFVPKHAATLYTNYNLSRWIDGLSVGGDVIYQGGQNVRYTTRSNSYADRSTLVPTIVARVPHNLTLDAFASYQFGAYRVGLNVYNIANRLNYTQEFGNRAVPAPGRTVIASLGATF